MRRDRLGPFDEVEVTHTLSEDNIFRSRWCLVLSSKEVVRKANLELVSFVDLIEVFLGELKGESFNVAF